MARKPAPRKGKSGPPARGKKVDSERVASILRQLQRDYPDVDCALEHETPFHLLIATILSAQCTDERVNRVTPGLFRAYPTPGAFAAADPADVEDRIRSTGFFRNKAKSILGASRAVVERHGGELPTTMEELTKLPGVGRKTANVILGTAFQRNDGVVVDTHVKRISRRLGLTRQTDPVKIEQDLMKTLPREEWTIFSHRIIWHGRKVCKAIRPRCGECRLATLCPSAEV